MTDPVMITALYCLPFGALAGLLSGLMGIGGGLVLVPLFYYLFPHLGVDHAHLMSACVATSLVTIIVTASSSALSHWRMGNLNTRRFMPIAGAMVVGGSCAGLVMPLLATELLRSVFALFALFIAWRMVRGAKDPEPEITKSGVLLHQLSGSAIIGLFSALMGIAGGALLVPFLNRMGIAVRQAIGIAAACGVVLAISGSISYALVPVDAGVMPAGSLGYVYLPAAIGVVMTSVFFAPLGAKLNQRLPIRRLKQLFALLLAVVSMRLLFS